MHPQHRALALAVASLVVATASLPAHSQSLEATRMAAKRALQTNPEVTARLNAYLGKVEAQKGARAGYLPRLDLSANYGTDLSQVGNIKPSQEITRGGARLTLTQVLWDGLATRDAVTRAGHERLGRWFELVEASEQTALDAARAVYDVQRQRKLVALAEDNLMHHQQAANKLESRVRAGVGRGVDLDQARARQALAEANRDTEVSNLHDVAARYQRIVGEAPAADMGAIELLRGGLPSSADDAVQQALSRSAAIAAGIEGVRAARASHAASRSALQPQVSARASVAGGKNLGGVEDRKADASVELLLNWNLFNGGADSARIREQEQAVRQAMDARDKACRDARQNAMIAFNDATKLSVQLNTQSRNSAAIERARDAYRQQFDIGQRSLLDLLNAENEAYTARRALTNLVYDRAIAYARTLAASTQLNVQLGIARETLPMDANNWTPGTDSAGRCPAVAVDVNPLRSGADASLPLAAAPQAYQAPALQAMPMTPMSVGNAGGMAMGSATGLGGGSDAGSTVNARARTSPAALAAQERAERIERVMAERNIHTGGAGTAHNATAAVTNQIQNWVRSWRARDTAALTSLYAPGFKGTAASPAAWAQQQRRLASSAVDNDMEVEDVVVKELPGGQVEARFLQSLTTANGIEVDNVSQTWQQVGGQWRIVRERKL
jgi:outer membrane protein, adhesin transport system